MQKLIQTILKIGNEVTIYLLCDQTQLTMKTWYKRTLKMIKKSV